MSIYDEWRRQCHSEKSIHYKVYDHVSKEKKEQIEAQNGQDEEEIRKSTHRYANIPAYECWGMSWALELILYSASLACGIYELKTSLADDCILCVE